MATFTQRDGRWRAQVRLRGAVESRTFDTKAQARAWATERESQLRTGIGGATGRKTLRDAMERFRDEVSPTRRGHRWETLRLDKLMREMSCVDQPLRDLTPDHLAADRDKRLRAVAPGSVLREMSLIGAVLEHARREWRWLAMNPLRDVRRPARPKPRTRLVTDDERDRIVMALGYDEASPVTTFKQQVAIAFLLALETAMRAGEILGLKRSLIRDRVARLPMTKNGDARDVPLSKRAGELLERLPNTGDALFTVKPGVRDALFRAAVKDAQIDGLTFHDSRATALTRLSRKLDAMTLARVSGHRDLAMLLRVYYRESMADIASRLD